MSVKTWAQENGVCAVKAYLLETMLNELTLIRVKVMEGHVFKNMTSMLALLR